MTEIHSHLARVRLLSGERIEELFDNLHQRDASLSSPDAMFFWDAEISNDQLDSHFTHMSESTLRNYAEDAQRGVAFLKGHDWHSLPIGYSLSGVLGEENGRQRVTAGFYTVRGIAEADDLISRMEARLVRDVSVGFHGGRMVCDICGSDFWDCRHFPGLTYEEKQGDVVSRTLSTFTIDDARLSEVSGVFDGSTPDAMILKAQRAAKAGELTKEQVQLLESKYRIALPVSRTFPVIKEEKMEVVAEIRAILGLGEEADVLEGVKSLKEAEKRIAALETQAAEGVQYRNDLVAEAIAEGIRAQGAAFKKDVYEGVLRNSPLEVVKQMRDDWKATADKVLPSGRHSQDSESTSVPIVSFISDDAYRA